MPVVQIGREGAAIFAGEQGASAFPPPNFGINEREQNASYDKTSPYNVHTKTVHAPTFAIADMRASHEAFGSQTPPGARHLIKQFLVVDPTVRCTAAHALEHGWFAEAAE